MLLASYGFYAGAGAWYLLGVLLLVTALSYGCGMVMGNSAGERGKGLLLGLGVVGNLAILIAMKYLPFLAKSLSVAAGVLPSLKNLPEPPLLVSIGVSFFVFQAIGYLIDVYLEVESPERDATLFALSLAFFPKLLQGPIERCGDLAAQFREPYRFDYDNIRSGTILFFWGVFKKVVVADRLALFVDAAYENPHGYAGISLVMATLFFAFQLYFDFSGYTDMAIGSARLFNIRLSANFNSPYLATSVSDFWRRWHMTFSRWVLNYLFRPLQMRWRELGNLGSALALLVTFAISGLWHGAEWGYIVWGCLHGIYMACAIFWKPFQKKIYRRLGIEKSAWLIAWQISTTFALTCFAWIFFRAGTFENGWYVVTHLWTLPAVPSASLGDFVQRNLLLGESVWDFYLALLLLLFMAVLGWYLRRTKKIDLPEHLAGMPTALRWTAYYALMLTIVFGGMFDNGSFIYYKF